MMTEPPERWWEIEERPFQSGKPLVGPLIVWVRTLWNSVSTKWYVRPLVNQQNAVNQRLVSELRATCEELRATGQELQATQGVVAALDREMADMRRIQAQAIYRLQEEVDHLKAQLDRTPMAVEQVDGV